MNARRPGGLPRVCVAWLGACGPTGVPGAVGPGRPRDRHTRACGSEWSISKPARALRALRRPPHQWGLVADVARRVVSKPGQAPPPPTGTAARPSGPSGALLTGGAWCAGVWFGASPRCPARPRHCLNYMPKGSGRWPLSEADLDVIADQRGERPGKTLNWGTPEQRLELLLRT